MVIYMPKRLTVTINRTFNSIVVVLNSSSSHTSKLDAVISPFSFDLLLLFGKICQSCFLEFIPECFIIISMILVFGGTSNKIANLFPVNFCLNKNVFEYTLRRYSQLWNHFVQLLLHAFVTVRYQYYKYYQYFIFCRKHYTLSNFSIVLLPYNIFIAYLNYFFYLITIRFLFPRTTNLITISMPTIHQKTRNYDKQIQTHNKQLLVLQNKLMSTYLAKSSVSSQISSNSKIYSNIVNKYATPAKNNRNASSNIPNTAATMNNSSTDRNNKNKDMNTIIEYKQQMTKLQVENQKLTTQNQHLHLELQTIVNQYKQLHTHMEQQNRNKEPVLKQYLSSIKQLKSIQEEKIALLQNQYEKNQYMYDNDRKILNRDLENSTLKLDEKRGKIQKYAQSSEQMKKEIIILNKEVQRMKVEIKELQQSIADFREDNISLKLQNKNLKADNKILHSQYDSMQKQQTSVISKQNNDRINQKYKEQPFIHRSALQLELLLDMTNELTNKIKYEELKQSYKKYLSQSIKQAEQSSQQKMKKDLELEQLKIKNSTLQQRINFLLENKIIMQESINRTEGIIQNLEEQNQQLKVKQSLLLLKNNGVRFESEEQFRIRTEENGNQERTPFNNNYNSSINSDQYSFISNHIGSKLLKYPQSHSSPKAGNTKNVSHHLNAYLIKDYPRNQRGRTMSNISSKSTVNKKSVSRKVQIF